MVPKKGALWVPTQSPMMVCLISIGSLNLFVDVGLVGAENAPILGYQMSPLFKILLRPSWGVLVYVGVVGMRECPG